MVGWRAYHVESYVTWCGHAQEVLPRPSCRLVPVLGEAPSRRPNHDDHH